MAYWELVFHFIEKKISDQMADLVRARFGAQTTVALEQPKQSSFGELAIPAAFQLARQLKQAPKAIAAELVAALGPLEGVSALEVAGNGYINVRLDRGAYGLRCPARRGKSQAAAAGKIIVEHTNINPNKAAHIGHLRNAILGDTFVRMLRAQWPHGRSAELHRQHRRAGCRCGGGHFITSKRSRPGDVRRC